MVTKAGTVLSGLDIKGMVVIRADNVTIQNSKISSDGYSGVKVERGFKGASVINSDIDGMGSTAGSYGIMGNGTFVGNDIRGFENGINLTGGSSTVRGNYIHGLQAPGSPHYDGIQSMGGQSDTLIEGNTIRARGTSAIFIDNMFGPVNGVTVRNNYLGDDGQFLGYTMYVLGDRGGHYPVMNVIIRDNYIIKGKYGFYSIRPDYYGHLPTIVGNTEVLYKVPPERIPGGAMVPAADLMPQ
ncbi:hypothetical protein BB934_28440 (plasmid) [Microvirga ossetica]|uniref:Right handed beta helix domain-containing protein n=2 Tax=Microvirga ossetica TaxID=1882682 RepID=A0A1B2EQM5_9HYPH|nr:hypothetical protein BB934_28440 [Microvirga ossetica]